MIDRSSAKELQNPTIQNKVTEEFVSTIFSENNNSAYSDSPTPDLDHGLQEFFEIEEEKKKAGSKPAR